MSRATRILRALSLAFPLLLSAAPAWATVGVGAPPCDVRTIQAAVDRVLAAERAGNFSDPNIVVSAGVYQEAVRIDAAGISGNAMLTMTGGYDASCNAPQVGNQTTISAVGRSASAVRITGNIFVDLDTLGIAGANTPGSGGGIAFDGNGSLDLTNVVLVDNAAAQGGGLFLSGRSFLVAALHPGTVISRNTATQAGGGIRIQGNARLEAPEGNTWIVDNVVSATNGPGSGGGIQVVAPAEIVLNSVTIERNSARRGGGISVDNNNGKIARATLDMLPGGAPTIIDFNRASLTGGGLFVSDLSSLRCTQCRVNSNSAQEGAAMYADVGGGVIVFGRGTVNDNVAQTINGTPTGGSAVLIQTGGEISMLAVELRRNRGGHVFRGFGSSPSTHEFQDILVADNVVSDDLMVVDENGASSFHNSTFAGNTIGGQNVFRNPGPFSLGLSIVWQLGKTTLLHGPIHGTLSIGGVIAGEVDSLCCFSDLFTVDPQFVAPASGNYRLQPTSPALDFTTFVDGIDIDGFPRTVDLHLPGHLGGVDLGAYELQGLYAFDESFDRVAAPALPTNWINRNPTSTPGWMTVSSGALSAPNAAFTEDTTTLTDKMLESPAFDVISNAQLTFRQKLNLEFGTGDIAYDAVALEISIAGGPFTDILAAGGSFVTGIYDHTASTCCLSALGGRAVWGGSVPSYKTVVVNLPTAANGKSVKVRWRMATDFTFGAAGGGYWLDDVHIQLKE